MINSFKDTNFSPVLQESLEHGKRVANYALAIFKGLEPLHSLSQNWQDVLELGAKLHDIGWIYGKTAHHKVAAAMILANAIEGKTLPYVVPKSIRHLVALVARYHRRAEPSLYHHPFKALNKKEQKAIIYLASFIRLADAIDFSHTGAVKDVKVCYTQDNILLNLIYTKDCQAEMKRVHVKKNLICQVFSRELICSCDYNF